MKKWKKRMISECMDSVDWDEVHDMYVRMGWQWWMPTDDTMRVPQVDDLKRNAKIALKHVMRKKLLFYGSGRILAVRMGDTLMLSFGDDYIVNKEELD